MKFILDLTEVKELPAYFNRDDELLIPCCLGEHSTDLDIIHSEFSGESISNATKAGHNTGKDLTIPMGFDLRMLPVGSKLTVFEK